MCHPDPEGVDSRAGKKRLLMLLGVILLLLRSGLIVYVLSSCEWIQEGNKSTLVFTYLSRISNFGCGWRTLLIELKMIENISLSFWLGKKTKLQVYLLTSKPLASSCLCANVNRNSQVWGVYIYLCLLESACVCAFLGDAHMVFTYLFYSILLCNPDHCLTICPALWMPVITSYPSLSLLPSPQSGTLSCHHTPSPPHLKESQWKATILICFNVIFSFDKVWNAMAF